MRKKGKSTLSYIIEKPEIYFLFEMYGFFNQEKNLLSSFCGDIYVHDTGVVREHLFSFSVNKKKGFFKIEKSLFFNAIAIIIPKPS